MKASITARSAFELKNCHVMNAAGQTIGRLRDIVFYARQGVVSYAVIGLGGFCGIGERLISLPWTKLDIAPNGRFIRILGDCPSLNDRHTAALPSSAAKVSNSSNGRKTKKRSAKNKSKQPALRLVRSSGEEQTPSDDGLFYRMFYASQENLKRPMERAATANGQREAQRASHTAQVKRRASM